MSQRGRQSEKVHVYSGRVAGSALEPVAGLHDDDPEERAGTRSGFRSLFSRSRSQTGPNARTSRSVVSRNLTYHLTIPEVKPVRSSSHSPSSRSTTASVVDASFSVAARTAWEPPPLFQAYPQAVKYANLDASCLSTESILRTSGRRQSNATPRPNTPAADLDEIGSPPPEKTRKRARDRSPSSGQWSRKIFILVTSGYLLQYAGEGNHDRFPERIFQLSQDSIAFASDAIPGKHWVLQISHDPDVCDDEPMSPPKTIWSRIGIRSSTEKRVAKDFLLVCESPDELDSWLMIIRREIQRHGGVQYCSETPKKPTLEHKISQRFQVRRDPHQFSQGLTSTDGRDHSNNGPIIEDTPKFELLPEIKTMSGIWIDQGFLETRQSASGSSIVTATDLDALRDSSQWPSSATTAIRASLDDSMSSVSPAQEHFPLSAKPPPMPPVIEIQSITTPKDMLTPPKTSTSYEFRRSYEPQDDNESSQSSVDASPQKPRPLSGMPNFSLPTNRRLSRCSLVMSESPSQSTESLEMTVSGAGDAAASRERMPEAESAEHQKQRPVSTIAPLPSRDAIGKMGRPRVPTLPDPSAEIMEPSPIKEKDNGLQEPTKRHKTSGSTGSYTIFPRPPSSMDSSQTIAPSPAPNMNLPELPSESHQRASSHHARSISLSIKNNVDQAIHTPCKLRRPVSLMVIDSRASVQIQKAERSPAVQDAHFATNFGTVNPFERSSSTRVPNRRITSAPDLTTDYMMQSRANTVRRTSPFRKQARTSTPWLASGAAMMGPPVGPPPTGPLPAPPLSGNRSRRGSSATRVYLDLTRDEPKVMEEKF